MRHLRQDARNSRKWSKSRTNVKSPTLQVVYQHDVRDEKMMDTPDAIQQIWSKKAFIGRQTPSVPNTLRGGLVHMIYLSWTTALTGWFWILKFGYTFMKERNPFLWKSDLRRAKSLFPMTTAGFCNENAPATQYASYYDSNSSFRNLRIIMNSMTRAVR